MRIEIILDNLHIPFNRLVQELLVDGIHDLLVAGIFTLIASTPFMVYLIWNKEEDGNAMGFVGYYIIKKIKNRIYK